MNTIDALVEALENLLATVRGECPALLDELRDGDAHLSMQCDEALAQARAEQAEPVARKAFICTSCDGVYADSPVSQCDCMPPKAEFREAWICTTPPAAPVVKLEPLHDDQIDQILEREQMKWAGNSPRTYEFAKAFARAIEAAHNAKLKGVT